jgi:cytochrome b561
MKNNNSNTYGITSRVFHWSMAGIFFGIFPLGYIMVNMDDSDFKFSLFNIHKCIGVLLFSLVAARLIWRLITAQPALPRSVPAWQRHFARFNIAMLYVLMFAMPVSGFMGSILGGYGINFSLFTIPPIAHDKLISEFFEELHGLLAYSLIFFFSLHLLGALYHHYFLRDGVFKRMWIISK